MALGARRLPVQELQDLSFLGEAAHLVLGKDHLAVDLDVKYAALTADELGVHAVALLDRGRETRGPGRVVSNLAVGNGHGHVDEHKSSGGERQEPAVDPVVSVK